MKNKFILVALLITTGQLLCNEGHPRWGNCFQGKTCYDMHDRYRDYALNGCEGRDEDEKRSCYAYHATLLKYFTKECKKSVAKSMVQLQEHIAQPVYHAMFIDWSLITKELAQKHMSVGKKYYDYQKHLGLLNEYIYHRFQKGDRFMPTGFSSEAIAKIIKEEVVKQEETNPGFIKNIPSASYCYR